SLRTYRGRLVDAQGRPVTGAQLRLFAANDRSAARRGQFPFNWQMIESGQLAQQANTVRFLEGASDSEGRFAFAGVPARGEVELAWWRKGIVPGRRDHLERLGDAERESLEIVTPAGARIIGAWKPEAFAKAARL